MFLSNDQVSPFFLRAYDKNFYFQSLLTSFSAGGAPAPEKRMLRHRNTDLTPPGGM